MTTNTTKKSPKNADKFICVKCNFKCSKQSDYDKHTLTAKHKYTTDTTELQPIVSELFNCECGKIYKSKQGFQQHKKKCTYIEDITFGNYNELLLQTLNNCDN